MILNSDIFIISFEWYKVRYYDNIIGMISRTILWDLQGAQYHNIGYFMDYDFILDIMILS